MKQVILAVFLISVICGCGKKVVPASADENGQACAGALAILDRAKEVWAQQLNRTAEDTPTLDDLAPFVRHMPACPSGGNYTLGKVSEKPTCSIAAHNEAFQKRLKEEAAAPAQ